MTLSDIWTALVKIDSHVIIGFIIGWILGGISGIVSFASKFIGGMSHGEWNT